MSFDTRTSQAPNRASWKTLVRILDPLYHHIRPGPLGGPPHWGRLGILRDTILDDAPRTTLSTGGLGGAPPTGWDLHDRELGDTLDSRFGKVAEEGLNAN